LNKIFIVHCTIESTGNLF